MSGVRPRKAPVDAFSAQGGRGIAELRQEARASGAGPGGLGLRQQRRRIVRREQAPEPVHGDAGGEAAAADPEVMRPLGHQDAVMEAPGRGGEVQGLLREAVQQRFRRSHRVQQDARAEGARRQGAADMVVGAHGDRAVGRESRRGRGLGRDRAEPGAAGPQRREQRRPARPPPPRGPGPRRGAPDPARRSGRPGCNPWRRRRSAGRPHSPPG